MEAEYVLLSTSCQDLFPLIDLTKEICSALSLHLKDLNDMYIKVHKDNVGTLVLGKLEFGSMMPRSKHYVVKYHWFREYIGPHNIQLIKINTKDQLGGLFTKGLDKIALKRLKKQLMG
jgi:hypothetical protein